MQNYYGLRSLVSALSVTALRSVIDPAACMRGVLCAACSRLMSSVHWSRSSLNLERCNFGRPEGCLLAGPLVARSCWSLLLFERCAAALTSALLLPLAR